MPNTKGGKKHKRNKKQNDYVEKALRLKEEDQEYAQITRCLGNCRFTVMCFDGKERKSIHLNGFQSGGHISLFVLPDNCALYPHISANSLINLIS